MGRAPVNPCLRALLAGLIDYAGLFPPASLSMADAVSRYAGYRRGPDAWMLGRFIVSRDRLEELEEVAAPLMATRDASEEPWRISVLAGADLILDYVRIKSFNTRHHATDHARIDTAEVAVDASSDAIARVVTALPTLSRLWFEAAPGPTLRIMLDAMKQAGVHVGAKLRTGGTTPGAIPNAGAVAHFLVACARAGVMFKATAGLHHPLHAPHRLTYADDSPTALMHGFVNVFLAAVLAHELVRHQHQPHRAREGVRADVRAEREDAGEETTIEQRIIELLDEREAHRIVWHDDHVTWRGHALDITAITAARARFASSFGSCSFEEPIQDLAQLGWL